MQIDKTSNALPPPYDQVTQPNTYLDVNNTCHLSLRSGTKYSKSPSKAQLKDDKRKAEMKVDRAQKKLKVVTAENKRYHAVIGVKVRDIMQERDDMLERVENLEEEKKKAAHDAVKMKSMQTQIQTLSKERDAYKEKATQWKDAAMSLIDESMDHVTECKKTKRMERQLREVEKEQKKLKTQLTQKDKEMTTLKQRIKEAEENIEIDREAAAIFLDGIVSELKEQLKEKTEKEKELQETIHNLTSLETKEKGGLYKTEIRLVYYHLLTLGVSSNQIESVIRTVLGHLSPMDLKDVKLPKRSTAQRLKCEAGQLATLRGLVEWSKRENKDVAYMTDKTTKGQLEWLTHKLVLSPSHDECDTGSRTVFTLGLTPIAGGKAKDTLDDLRKLLSELQRLGTDMNLQDVEETYNVINFKARMSDRAATEGKLTKLLCEMKTEELERLLPTWNEMTETERDEKIRIHAFTCGAHKLTNMTEAMNKAAVKYLYADDHDSTFRRMQGAKKHIYEADKLLCEQSKKEYAKGKDFKAFCLSQDTLKKSASQLFTPIVGSRYLIYFHNSLPTYVGRQFIQIFLVDQRDSKGHWNKLEASVYDGYNDLRIMAEERAYAILYYEVCLPLMVKTKSVKHILEMNEIYDASVKKLKEWSEDPESLFEGSEKLWTDAVRNESHKMYMLEVRRPDDTDNKVKEILKVCCAAGAEKLAQHAREHLPGGEFAVPTQQQIQAASLLPGATNDPCESDFGLLDQMSKSAPSSNPMSLSSVVRAKRDKATDWAMRQDQELKEKLVHTAQKEAKRQHKMVGTKDRQLLALEEIKKKEREEKIRKRQAVMQKKEMKQAEMRKELAEDTLIRDQQKIRKLSGAQCNRQLQLWNLLAEDVNINNSERLKGRSKLTVEQKRKLLLQLVKTNTNVMPKFKEKNPSVVTVVNMDSSSDDDDDNLPLVEIIRPKSYTSDEESEDNLPLSKICRRDTDDDDDQPLSDYLPLSKLIK